MSDYDLQCALYCPLCNGRFQLKFCESRCKVGTIPYHTVRMISRVVAQHHGNCNWGGAGVMAADLTRRQTLPKGNPLVKNSMDGQNVRGREPPPPRPPPPPRAWNQPARRQTFPGGRPYQLYGCTKCKVARDTPDGRSAELATSRHFCAILTGNSSHQFYMVLTGKSCHPRHILLAGKPSCFFLSGS